jgi:hypothetical protein
MVTTTDILVNGRSVARIVMKPNDPQLVIAALRDELKRQNDGSTRRRPGRSRQREITIMGDKGTPFSVLKRVMATATAADHGKVSLAVIQHGNEVGAGMSWVSLHFRRFQLPWALEEESERKFKLVRICSSLRLFWPCSFSCSRSDGAHEARRRSRTCRRSSSRSRNHRRLLRRRSRREAGRRSRNWKSRSKPKPNVRQGMLRCGTNSRRCMTRTSTSPTHR